MSTKLDAIAFRVERRQKRHLGIHDGYDFWRGILIALPLSLACWFAIYEAVIRIAEKLR
jgi:hypothetical protein